MTGPTAVRQMGGQRAQIPEVNRRTVCWPIPVPVTWGPSRPPGPLRPTRQAEPDPPRHLGCLASGIDWPIDFRDCADPTAARGGARIRT